MQVLLILKLECFWYDKCGGSSSHSMIFPFQVDLRDDPSMIEKLAKNKQKPISSDVGEKLAKELKAVKYVECSALTQVCHFLF